MFLSPQFRDKSLPVLKRSLHLHIYFDDFQLESSCFNSKAVWEVRKHQKNASWKLSSSWTASHSNLIALNTTGNDEYSFKSTMVFPSFCSGPNSSIMIIASSVFSTTRWRLWNILLGYQGDTKLRKRPRAEQMDYIAKLSIRVPLEALDKWKTLGKDELLSRDGRSLRDSLRLSRRY